MRILEELLIKQINNEELTYDENMELNKLLYNIYINQSDNNDLQTNIL